ncbi:MAG: helix-turn-helix domain-containing protein, partial [Actinomycetota bacterium]|nr:helix-turn-helix domain-containing protein [Actinomycetota bacterium]
MHHDDLVVVEAGVRVYGLSVEQQEEVWRRWREGEAPRSVARQLGAPVQHVRRYVGQNGGVRPRPAGRSARHLSLREREEISRGLAAGWTMRRIAAGLGRPASTVSREVARNGGRHAYRAHDADTAAYERAQRPKPCKLRAQHQASRRCSTGSNWSGPRSRSATGCAWTTPTTRAMRVSHETIYLSLFVPARSPLS